MSKNHRKTLVLLLLGTGFLLLSSIPVMAQRKIKPMDPEKAEREAAEKEGQNSNWTDRLVFGGNFMASFGNTFSQVLIAPLVGYKVNERFIAGAGVTYMYWSQSLALSNGQTLDYSDNVYGLNLFGRHSLFGPLFAHAEYQPMNFTAYNGLGDHKRQWSNALYLGGGVNQSIGNSGAFYVMLLYDVLWEDYPTDPRSYPTSFMLSPLDIRIGFFF